MKKIYLLLFSLLPFFASSQTTITTSYVTNTIIFSTGSTYITFDVQNTNAFPVVLTGLTNLQANLYENNVYSLWYSSTSLFGAPTLFSSSAGWSLLATSDPFTSTIISYVSPFNCLGLTIPAGQTYRFALQGSKGTAVAGGVTPNVFSGGGVNLFVGNNTTPGGQVGYFSWQNIGNSGTPYFFDGSITIAPANTFNDIEVKRITKPASICNFTSNTILASICNKGTQNLNLGTNNATVNFNVTGPGAPQTSSTVLNSGILPPCGCTNAIMNGVNFFQPGDYHITASATLAGLTESTLANNIAQDSITNYKPSVSPLSDSVCQFSNNSVFAGYTASGCQTIHKSVTATAIVSGTVDGTSDATAGQFAIGSLPTLPTGAVLTGAKLFISNLNAVPTSTFGNELRFNIYGAAPNGPSNPFLPGLNGNFLNFSVYNLDYSSTLSSTQINNMYTAIGGGGTFYIGYWETNNNVAGSDITLNAQTFPTVATLTVEYNILPFAKWYTVASGGSSILNSSAFNPLLTSGSGISNTNSVNTYTYYAACSSDSSCRVPVSFKVNESPIAIQDTIGNCEVVSGSGIGIFDLTAGNGVVSNNVPNTTVAYYQDIALNTIINNPSNYVSPITVVYSKVSITNGCFASDSVVLTVTPKPDFVSNLVDANACSPITLDASSLINPFCTVPLGTDTLFFSDSLYTIPFVNPHSISVADTVYVLFVTNTLPACKDSLVEHINIQPYSNYIANQDLNLNTSNPGNIACGNILLSDAVNETYHTFTDCRRVASVLDIVDGTNLGSTSVCEVIEASTPFHNGQPYLNRHFQITPTNNDSGYVCLYVLDDDFAQYNADAISATPSWPQLPTALFPAYASNLCVTKVDNGDLNTPGHIASVIPNAMLSTSYDPITTVWTVCFPVSSFSYFYLHAQNLNNFPLPVTLLQVAANKLGEQTYINWTTASEINNSHFIVERSYDGVQFKAISDAIFSKAINGNSASPLDYAYTDQSPKNGHNYYRLQMIDLDKRQRYSDVHDVYFGSKTVVTLYPNPVQNELGVSIYSPYPTIVDIQIMDAAGRTIQSVQTHLLAGDNQQKISLQDVSEGIYLVNVTDGKGLQYSQLIRKK